MNNLNTIKTKFNYPCEHDLCEQLGSVFALDSDICEARRDELSVGLAGNARMYLPNNISMDVDHMLEKKKIKLLALTVKPLRVIPMSMMLLHKTVGTELQ